MKCTVSRENLQKLSQAVKKFIGKVASIYLEVLDGELAVIVNSSLFLRFTVPIEDDEASNGIVSLSQDRFDALVKDVRGKKLKMELEAKTLHITSGSKLKLFCNELSDDSISPPEVEESAKVKLKAKSVSSLKKVVDLAKFSMIYSEVELPGIPVLVKQSKGVLTLGFADTAHCVFYCQEAISDKDFGITTLVSPLKALFSIMDGSAKFDIGESMIVISCDNLFASIPAVQLGIGMITTAWKTLNNDDLFNQQITLRYNSLIKVINSLAVVADGSSDFITCSSDDQKLNFMLKTSYGSAKDSVKIDGKIKLKKVSIPLLYLQETLNSCSGAETLTVQFAKDMSMYKVLADIGKIQVKCINPLIAT